VLLLLSLNPLIAAGKGTFLDELITAARGENIARGAGISYPVLSREEIFHSKPDVIIATSDIVKARDAIAAAYPEWRELPAIQNKRIAIVDASLVSRPGPRIVEGLEVVARMIHGER
jgi:iron complex transport system substrate-binding protein